MVTAQQQAPSHASSTRQALGQLAGLPGARSLAGAAAWNLRACKYCSSRGEWNKWLFIDATNSKLSLEFLP